MKLVDERTVYISDECEIDDSAVIYPNNTLMGKCVIGKNVIINPNCILENAVICDNVEITASVIKDSIVGEDTTVGPFAYLRNNATVGKGCRIGDFVEIKNSKLGDGTKMSHLAYAGDCEVGKDCNIGCGAIFVNYDGVNKHKSYVGDHCFIGSNCNIIAPVSISSDSYIAAGTTITHDLPENAFAIGRSRQEIKQPRTWGKKV